MRMATVCKNIIFKNNKKGWVDPEPTIRLCRTPSGKVTARAHVVGITDAEGRVVATLISTKDGKPVVKCGAKVALVTDYDMVVLD